MAKVGLGFREPFKAELFRCRAAVDFLEIVADRYLDVDDDKLAELDLLHEHFTVIPHAIDLSLGSSLDGEYLEHLAGLIERLHPPYWSEHISYTHAGGIAIGHLAPLPFTREAVATVARNVREVRRVIPVPLVLENISYVVRVPRAEMSEGEFVRRVLEETDCGLLLDVTNLYTNACNHGYDARRFLDEVPLQRATQVHLAGGEWRDGVLIDSHSSPTPDPVLALLREVLARMEVPYVVVERDENLPPFGEMLAELERVRSIVTGGERVLHGAA